MPEVPAHEEEQMENNLLVGRNPIREALRAGRDIEKLLVQRGELSGSAREIVGMARDAKIIVQEVDRVRLDQMAPNHQGLIAVLLILVIFLGGIVSALSMMNIRLLRLQSQNSTSPVQFSRNASVSARQRIGEHRSHVFDMGSVLRTEPL